MTTEDIELIEAAKAGNGVAQTSLGIRYYYGRDIVQDYDEAAKWFLLAIREDYPLAFFNLGVCFLNGHGVYKNIPLAFALFKTAADKGCTKGLNCRYTAHPPKIHQNRSGTEPPTVNESQYMKVPPEQSGIPHEAPKEQPREPQKEQSKKPEVKPESPKDSQNEQAKPESPKEPPKPQPKEPPKPQSKEPPKPQPKLTPQEAAQERKRHIEKYRNKHYMPQAAKDKLAEPLDESSPRATAKQKKRNNAIENFPWAKLYRASFNIDIPNVSRLMDEQLYGLSTAKRQVLRFLAVCKRNPTAPLRPLLLIGPAGTGKTSFGKVIAEAMGKPFKSISMPSLSVGHQFTGSDKYYETAGWGIIIQSIMDAGECPVFLFDEVDKAGKEPGRYSAPIHGLLNLLDDSRDSFSDEFFEVPVDLRNAFFILTANDKKNVDKFVLDRCKVIDIEGYKDPDDRRIILENYVLPKLCKEYNLAADKPLLSETAIDMILSESIDREGGLRTLQAQAESVLQEAILCMDTNQTTDCVEILTPDEVGEVLAEITSQSSRTIGFSAEYDMP